ncbi:MAG: hypothetical protein U9Q91_02820 [Candidatus Marinimicrobia bacterium]|nr:hypothetical protein [Candidatus Neomarinimicrobiota bacterium]
MKKVTYKIFRILLIIFLWVSTLPAQILILDPTENNVTDLHHIAVTIMGKPSAEARLYMNDQLVSSGEIRADGIYDFINISVPDGSVSLRVEALGALNRMYMAERKIHILGSPQQILPYEEKVTLPADGSTSKVLKFEIQDQWGYRLDHLKVATLRLDYGNILNQDIDDASNGIQVPVIDGVVEVKVRSASKAGRALLQMELIGEVFDYTLQYTTPQLPFILVGSISGAASNYRDFGNNGDAPDVEEWRQDSTSLFGAPMLYGGRMAFYAKGSLFNRYGLTVSYDSKRNYRDEFYRDIDPSDQYAVYGDASTLEYDAQTQSQFFAKLEHNESSLIYGDYNTAIDQTEFTAYNRTFNGFVGNLKGRTQSLKGFITLSDREMKLDEIRGEGISGYYYLAESNITEYSDKIVIQTHDRYHSEIIIRSLEQVRFQDYSINYEDGSIMFKQPIPSIDTEGNPVTITVAYEYQSGQKETMIGGVRYDGTFFKKLKLGATAIAEEKESSNYLLYGVDASLPLFNWLSFKGEYAVSNTPQFGVSDLSGKAYKAEMQFKPSKFINVKAYYRTVDSSFVNTSQTGKANETGSEKYGIKGVMGNEKTGLLSSEYYKQLNKLGSVNENTAEVFNTTYKRNFGEKTLMMLAYENAKRENNSISDTTTSLQSQLLRARFDYQIFKKLSGFIERDQNLLNTDQSKPTHTAIGLTYSITEKLGILVKYKRIEGENAGNQLVFGVDSKIGNNTQLTGKYEIGGATGDSRNRATIGLKNKWSVTKDFTLNFAYENVSTSDQFETPTTEHQALSVSYEYLPEIPFKTTGKYEFNIKSDTKQNNIMFNMDFKIAHGFAMISKLIYSKIDYRANEGEYIIKADNQLGLAIRPERSDRYNSLVKVAYIINENTHVQPKVNMQRFIISSHHYWQPTKRLELGFRFARRIVIDEEIGLFKDKITTDYLALRMEYDLSIKWYTACDVKYLRLMPLNETKFGSSIEIGYLLVNNFQIGVGYAFNNYEDPDFSSNNYMFKNFFLTMHMKFSEDIFNWK